MKTLTIIFLSSLLTPVYAQSIYKTVDDQGNVSYSSSVDKNAENVEVLTPPPEPSAEDVEAARQQEKELEKNLAERMEKSESYMIERSKAAASSMKGEQECRKCGGPNDRFHDGYVVCSDCVQAEQ